MTSRLPLVVLLTASLLSTFPTAAVPEPFAHQTTQGIEPFDKLELFGLFAAGPVGSYAAHVIQERGTNFTPDVTFISSFPAGFQAILKTVKPRVAHTPAPDLRRTSNAI